MRSLLPLLCALPLLVACGAGLSEPERSGSPAKTQGQLERRPAEARDGGSGHAEGRTEAGRFLLQLAELPRGYRIGEQRWCESGASERARLPELAGLLPSEPAASCAIRFELIDPADRTIAAAGPPLIASVASVFPSAEGARAALALGEQLIEAREQIEAVEVGDEAKILIVGAGTRLFVTDDVLLSDELTARGAVILWQHDRTLSYVLVGGSSGLSALETAADLAERQQRRVESPPASPPGDR